MNIKSFNDGINLLPTVEFTGSDNNPIPRISLRDGEDGEKRTAYILPAGCRLSWEGATNASSVCIEYTLYGADVGKYRPVHIAGYGSNELAITPKNHNRIITMITRPRTGDEWKKLETFSVAEGATYNPNNVEETIQLDVRAEKGINTQQQHIVIRSSVQSKNGDEIDQEVLVNPAGQIEYAIGYNNMTKITMCAKLDPESGKRIGYLCGNDSENLPGPIIHCEGEMTEGLISIYGDFLMGRIEQKMLPDEALIPNIPTAEECDEAQRVIRTDARTQDVDLKYPLD